MLSKNVLQGPKGNVLLGNLLEFRKNELDFLTWCAHEYGEIVPLRLLHLSICLLLNPSHIEYVLNTHSRGFAKSRMYKLLSSILGEGLVLSEGDVWLRQRRLMQPAFHRQRIAVHGQVMSSYAERMISTWQEGQVLEVYQSMTNLALEIAAKTLFDSEVSNDTDGVIEALNLVAKEFSARFSSPIPIPESIPTPGNVRYRKGVRQLEEVVYQLIRRRRAVQDETDDLLSMLLHAQDEDGSWMTDQQLRDELMTLLIAGYDTTAVLLTWIWYLLGEHPEVEAKLLAELKLVLNGRSPAMSDLPKLSYTEMIVTEALRLYPSVPLLGRESLKDFELGGYHFRSGTELWIVPWVIHRNPLYYPSPDEFKPERWDGDLAKRLPNFAYIPFGGGPRLCIGNIFALTEAKLVLATVAQRFHLQLMPNQVVLPQFSGTLRPKHEIKMLVTKRFL